MRALVLLLALTFAIPATAALGDIADQASLERLPLTFFVNGTKKGALETLFNLETSEVFLDQEVIKALGLNIALGEPKRITGIPELKATFDQAKMQVNLTTDASLLNTRQAFSFTKKQDFKYSAKPDSVYFNYALNNTDSFNQYNFETGINIGDTQFHATAACKDSCLPNEYTVFQDDKDKLTKSQAGDYFTRDGDHILGFGAGTFFNLNPYFIKQPSVNFTGVAQSASKVEVFVDNILRFKQDVLPGQFTINEIRSFYGVQNLEIRVTDAYGVVKSYGQELFGTRNLLAEGLQDYQFNVGIDRDPALDRMDYSGLMSSGYYRAGISKQLTGGLNYRVNEDVQRVGVEADYAFPGAYLNAIANINNRGDYQVAASLRNEVLDGLQWSLNAQHRDGQVNSRTENNSSSTFLSATGALPVTSSARLNATISHEITKASAHSADNIVLQENASPFIINDKNVSSLNVGISKRLNLSNTMATLTANAMANTDGEHMLSMGLNIPFGSLNKTVTDKQDTTTANAFKNARSPTEWGFRASQVINDSDVSKNENDSLFASKGFDHVFVSTNLNQSSNGDTQSQTYSNLIAGGVVYTPETGLNFTRPVKESFVIAKVGAPDIEVLANGRSYGKTGNSGNLVLPEIPAYAVGKVGINKKDLKESFVAKKLNDGYLNQRYAGSIVDFGVKQVAAVYGKIAGFESSAFRIDNKTESFTASNGEFYVDDITLGKHTLEFSKLNSKTATPEKFSCTFEATGREAVEDVGDVNCLKTM